MNYYEELGIKLKTYRKRAGVTLEEVAKELNKSIATISKYESGDVCISIDVLIDMCKFMNIDIHQLIPNTYVDYQSSEAYKKYSNIFEDVLYIYWYNGEDKTLKVGVMEHDNMAMTARYYMNCDVHNHYDCKYIYKGKVIYGETSILYGLTNLEPPFDFQMIRVPTLTKRKKYRVGMISAVSYYYQNVALKCVASSKPIADTDQLIESLMISKDEMKGIKKTNYLIID